MINGNGAYASGKQTTDYGIKYYQSAVDEFAKQFAGLMNKLNAAMSPTTDLCSQVRTAHR